MKFKAILFLFLLFISIGTASAVEFGGSDADYGFSNGIMTDNTGLTYETNNDGVVTVNDERFLAFALKGTYAGTEYTYTSMDYEWTWTYTVDGTDHIFEAINDDPNFVWEQYWLFYEDEPMKIIHSIKNNYPQDITDMQMYYLTTVQDADTIQYDGNDYPVGDIKPLFIQEDLNDIEASINFNDEYDFNFMDIVSEGFDINEFYLGSGSVIGYPAIDIMAVGFTKGAGTLNSGAEVWIDPTFSTSDIESVATCPLSSDSYILAWGDETDDDKYFKIMWTNGTVRVDTTSIGDHGDIFAHTSLDVVALNSTHWIYVYKDEDGDDVYADIYNVGSKITTLTIDLDIGLYSFSFGVDAANETRWGITWCDEVADKLYYALYDYDTQVGTNVEVADITRGYAQDIFFFNDTHHGITWFNGTSDDVFFAIYENDTKIVDNVTVNDNVGFSRAVKGVAITDTILAIAYNDALDYDQSFHSFYSNGTAISGEIDVNTDVGSDARSIGLAKKNSTHIYIGIYDDLSNNPYLALYHYDGTPVYNLDKGTIGEYFIDVGSSKHATGIGLDDESVVMMWVESSTKAVWDYFNADGTLYEPPLPPAPVVTLISQTPSTINQSSVGTISMKYGIVHDASGLNNTSVSFIYRNYDNDLGCSNHSIRPPDNNLAADWSLDGRILRGANRNETLNFENNDTITGGDIYSWSGLDENSSRLTIVPVNSTYTYVWINGTIHDIMPQMWYLDRTDMEEAPKTQVAIHKTQDVLIKFWSLELFKGNTNYIGVGYTDTALESNPALHPLDADPVEFYYINSSYDPATDGDPLTSGYAVFMGSGNASAWIDHVYSPHPNSNYVSGFIDNNLVDSVIDTSETAYLYFKSDTPSSKPYYINMTNVASSTNVSFADTDVLWSGAGAGTFTQLDYTPNVWFSFMKINMSFDHMLYVADNDGRWSNSTLNSTVITEGEFFPTRPIIDHFHYPDYATMDTDMDGLYNGTFDVGIAASTDPDGGVVTMNVTLHYENKTFVAVINNTVTSDDIIHNGVFVDIEFDSSPYYSNEVEYTMKIVATDDESYQSESWLSSNFTLSDRPIITSYSPTTPTTSIVSDYKEFEIFINQDSNVTWYLDTVEVLNETGVRTSSYSNSTAILGVHNLTVYVENDNGSTNQMWVWTVAPPLNFMPISIFLMWILIMVICFVGAVTGMYQEEDRIKGMIFSIIGVMDGFMLTDTTINGKLVSFFGHVSTDGVVLIGRDVVQNSALHWIVLFITLIFIGMTVYITFKFIKEKIKPVLEEEL